MGGRMNGSVGPGFRDSYVFFIGITIAALPLMFLFFSRLFGDGKPKKKKGGLASSVMEGVGKGGLRTVILRHAAGSRCYLYKHGATLCSYKGTSGREMIFVSEEAVFDGKKVGRRLVASDAT